MHIMPKRMRGRQGNIAGLLRRRISSPSRKGIPSYVGGALYFGHKGFWNGVLFGVQP